MLFISIIVKIICGIMLGYIVVKFGNAMTELGKVTNCCEYIYDENKKEWIPYKEENRIWLLHSILVFIKSKNPRLEFRKKHLRKEKNGLLVLHIFGSGYCHGYYNWPFVFIFVKIRYFASWRIRYRWRDIFIFRIRQASSQIDIQEVRCF